MHSPKTREEYIASCLFYNGNNDINLYRVGGQWAMYEQKWVDCHYTAKENGLQIKGQAFDADNDLYVHCYSSKEMKHIVIQVFHRWLGTVIRVDDPIKKFKAIKLIRG